MDRKNVFVIGLDDYHTTLLDSLRHRHRYRFHGLLAHDEVEHRPDYPVDEMLRKAEDQLRGARDGADAIVNYIDFPGSSMAAILAARLGLRGPSLESVLRCEHKAWSRMAQAEILPGFEPRFAAFDPFDDDPLARIGLPFPFWVKPVKGFGGWLGFKIRHERDLDHALGRIRAHIHRLAEPFDRLLDRAVLPDAVAPMRGHWCLAEEIVQGRQCTVEGHVLGSDVRIHGIVDSHRYPHRSSFSSYHYPSRLPPRIQATVTALARRLARGLGLEHTGFNIEFFWDQRHDRITVLEVNPRISQSHCEMFRLVDGASSHQVIVAVALGEEPAFPRREGAFPAAARCFLRHVGDAHVARVPSPEEIAAIERDLPGTSIHLTVRPGAWLSERPYTESYSYALAVITLGGVDHADIDRKHEACARRLRFDLDTPRHRSPQRETAG